MVLGRMISEALKVISDGIEEIKEVKKVSIDEKNYQSSIRIPRKLALKKNFNKDTEIEIVFNPSDETIERAKRSGFIMFPKEDDDGE